MKLKLNWHHLYGYLTKLLISYYEKEPLNTGKNLYKLFINNPNFVLLNNWISNFEKWDVQSLDPIHIFASFNYYDIDREVRLKKIFLYIHILEEELNEYITDLSDYKKIQFKGIPSVNLAKIMSARNEKSQAEIWDFFYKAITKNINEIDDFFELVNNWYGIKVPALTIFLFWANSDKYFPLDKNTVKLMKYNEIIIPTSTKEYILTLMDNSGGNIYREIVRIAYEKKT